MSGPNQKLELEIEVIQVSIYCDILRNILFVCPSISVIKASVFSFIIKKQDIRHVQLFSGKNSTDLVLKFLSQAYGQNEEFLAQLPYIFEAIRILDQSNICDVHEGILISSSKYEGKKGIFDKFTYDTLKESNSYSDRQFLKEVISIV